MDGWIDGWMDGWIDEWMDRSNCCSCQIRYVIRTVHPYKGSNPSEMRKS